MLSGAQLGVLRHHSDPELAGLAGAIQEGDDALRPILHDKLEDHNLMNTMVEVGKVYLIETVTFYWMGRVVKADFVCLTMENVWAVYETGDWTAADKNKKFQTQEKAIGKTRAIPLQVVTGCTQLADSWLKEK